MNVDQEDNLLENPDYYDDASHFPFKTILFLFIVAMICLFRSCCNCCMYSEDSINYSDHDEVSEWSTALRNHNRIVRVKKKVNNTDCERNENLMEA